MSEPTPSLVKIGAEVFVRSIRQQGVVTRVISPDQIEVTVGQLRIVLPRSDLRVEAAPDIKKPPVVTRSRALPPTSARCDLHGMTVAVALEALEQTISNALVHNISCVEIIHGMGSGKIHRAVLIYLSNSRHVRNHVQQPGNAGTTIAYL